MVRMRGGPNGDGMSERLSRDLAAVGELLAGIEDRLVEASRRVGEADGRLERELDRVHSDVGLAIQTLRDDVAAAIADVRQTVNRELATVPQVADLRDELVGRIEALEAEVRAARDAG
jgi:BMFP domain-containing protein YqiC